MTSIPKQQVIQRFIEGLVVEVTVADSDIETFYKENESTFCGTPLDKVRDRIKSYVLEDKRQRFVDDYIRQLGRNLEIVVSAKWVQEQATRAQDNPLDKARSSGKLTLAVFSAASCCGPDRMLPVIKAVRGAFGEALGVVYIEPREEQILAARYGVRSIPTQVFFDKTGREVYRHSGFLGEAPILEQLKKMGLQERGKG
jgi:thioredoxin 1